MLQYLQNAGLYESQEEAVSREEVLGRLDQVGFYTSFDILSVAVWGIMFFYVDFRYGIEQIVKIWVKIISRAKGLNEQLVHEANAKIFTFGSYRLGVWNYFLF